MWSYYRYNQRKGSSGLLEKTIIISEGWDCVTCRNMLLTVVSAIVHVKYYLSGHPFNIYTDHASLQRVMMFQKPMTSLPIGWICFTSVTRCATSSPLLIVKENGMAARMHSLTGHDLELRQTEVDVETI